MLSEEEAKHLERCVELAREALAAGDAPFGSILVDGSGNVLREERNRTVTEQDASQHPEFTLSLWAQKHLSLAERATATMYTSGEHCPMCSTLHANVGLGRIVYASSSKQLVQWRKEFGVKDGPVIPLAINQVAPMLKVEGPVSGFDELVWELHRRKSGKSYISLTRE